MHPFRYPIDPHQRRHGPSGYDNYESYRPWLRDEFCFRCVYCLKREQWGVVRASYNIDHYLAQSHHPEALLDYDNLLYCCANCNSAKGARVIPNPCACFVESQVAVHDDGRMEATTKDAQRIIRVLGLDNTEYREFRMLWIGIVRLAKEYRPELFQILMKYPDDLPDLSALRAPENSRPDGVKNSFFARREMDELPDVY